MPIISTRQSFNGFDQKIIRLKLTPLIAEVEFSLTRFQLLVKEEKHANGTQGLRKAIDEGFSEAGGWSKLSSGGVDWTKTNRDGRAVGVEVQVSGRSDMLAVDVLHLSEQLREGSVDVCVIVVPDDDLSKFLTDRTPNFSTALRHVQRAKDLPIQIIAFRHDGTGPALPKIKTNLGKDTA